MKINIDPITRISGFLDVQLEIENNRVVDAKSSGLLYRAFEKILVGREPFDAIYLTERICGICSTAHALASSRALENALEINPSDSEVIVRDIIHGAEFLQNHIRHFYLLVMPDYACLSNMFAKSQYKNSDFRLSEKETTNIEKNYIKAIEYSRMAHEIIAVLGGKAPHNHGIFPGENNRIVTSMQIVKIKALIKGIKDFVVNLMLEDAFVIAEKYKEYYKIGKGYGNLMTFGGFYVEPKVHYNNKTYAIDTSKISESINKDPYSFIIAPRYNNLPMEVGPLARMTLSGRYNKGISTMDRLICRILEAKLIATIIEDKLTILEKLNNKEDKTKHIMKDNAYGNSYMDTVRGALMHEVTIENKLIKKYNIITPSGWNLSPKDSHGIRGTLEQALIGTPIEDVNNPIEVGRIVRSFDPCVSCAVH